MFMNVSNNYKKSEEKKKEKIHLEINAYKLIYLQDLNACAEISVS